MSVGSESCSHNKGAAARPAVTVVGSFMMDLVIKTQRRPTKGETVVGTSFGMFPGGKGANQAVAAARLGARVEMVGRVGKDSFGDTFLRVLADEGVGTRFIVVDPEEGTGIGSPVIDADGDNSIIIVPRANMRVTPEDVERAGEAISSAKALLLQLEIPMAASARAARIARGAGATVILNPAPARELDDELLAHVDVLVPNEVELFGLVGYPAAATSGAPATAATAATAAAPAAAPTPDGRAPDDDAVISAATEMSRRYGCLVVVTLGERGAAFVGPGIGPGRVRAFEVAQVVDTTAAGDAFCGALAVSLSEGAGIEDAVRFACSAGAVAVTRLGAMPSLPARAEVEELLRAGRERA